MDYWIGVFTLTCIYLIAILGVSVLYGFTGLFTMEILRVSSVFG